MMDLDLIRIDGGTQSRVELNQETVAEYAGAYKAGSEFPPVIVFFDGTDRWLADGYHRYFGAKAAGLTEIYENVTPGTKLDAELYSFGANGKHGLPRTNADKRKAVTGALQHPVSGKWSDNQIAKHCGVSQPFVSSVRASLQTVISEESAERTFTTKHGTEAVMKTGNIGKPRAAEVQNPVKNTPENIPARPATPANGSAYDPREDELRDTQQTLADIAAENEELRDRLAVGVMSGTDAEKTEAAQTIADLRQQVKTLEAEAIALRSSRDHYQREASELRKQIKMNERELKKARASA